MHSSREAIPSVSPEAYLRSEPRGRVRGTTIIQRPRNHRSGGRGAQPETLDCDQGPRPADLALNCVCADRGDLAVGNRWFSQSLSVVAAARREDPGQCQESHHEEDDHDGDDDYEERAPWRRWDWKRHGAWRRRRVRQPLSCGRGRV